MRVDSLKSSLFFGAVAALALVFVQHLVAPIIGSTDGLVFYLSGATIAYAAFLGSTPRRALRNAAVAFVGAIGVVAVSGGIAGLALGLTGVLAFVRSGLEVSTKPFRALVVETTLAGLGLGFAAWVASPGWLGSAAALWSYALVQSLYFLVPGPKRRKSASNVGDPFERACERILGLLEEI